MSDQPKVLNVLGVMNASDINGKYVRAEDYDKIKAECDAAVEYAERMTCAVKLSEIDLGIERKRRERAEAFIDAAREVKP